MGEATSTAQRLFHTDCRVVVRPIMLLQPQLLTAGTLRRTESFAAASYTWDQDTSDDLSHL